MIREIFRDKRGLFAFIILFLLYFSAIFADFLSPYHYATEDRLLSYAPPTRLHFRDEEGRLHLIPFVYKYKFMLDENRRRIYLEDKSRPYPIRFFKRGDRYKFLGLFYSDIHLLGVDEPAKIYLLGADSRGRDLLSRILYGARVSLSIGIIAVIITFGLGLLIGGIAGYFGGKVDNFLMRICEMFMLVPSFYLLLALRSSFPPEIGSLKIYFLIVVILSFIGWASLARIIRGIVLSLREKEFVLSARAVGCSHLRIILKHILPNTASYTIVAVTLAIPGYILGESALSLLGLGIQDPLPSWGNLLSSAMSIVEIKFHPWILIPGIFIFLAVMAFNMLGDSLRDIYDPGRRGN